MKSDDNEIRQVSVQVVTIDPSSGHTYKLLHGIPGGNRTQSAPGRFAYFACASFSSFFSTGCKSSRSDLNRKTERHWFIVLRKVRQYFSC